MRKLPEDLSLKFQYFGGNAVNNAAIVIFKKSTLPKVLKFFVMPRINQIIEVGDNRDRVTVYIIQCPVMKAPADNR